MKKILFPLLCVSVLACSTPNKGEQTSAAVSPSVALEADSVSAAPDASSSATSKPNQASFNGVIVLAPQKQVTVALTMGGVVKDTRLLPGQRLAKGELIATIENPDFIILQQSYLESRAQAEFLAAEYERQRTLADQQVASQKRVQQSKADYLSMQSKVEGAAAQLSILGVDPLTLVSGGIQSQLKVYAPISGYVSRVDMNIGKYKQAGEPLCELIDKSAPLLRLTAYEKDMERAIVGQKLQFKVNGMGDKEFRATLISVGQRVDAVNRSIELYARIEDVHQQFRPGMYVMAIIEK